MTYKVLALIEGFKSVGSVQPAPDSVLEVPHLPTAFSSSSSFCLGVCLKHSTQDLTKSIFPEFLSTVCIFEAACVILYGATWLIIMWALCTTYLKCSQYTEVKLRLKNQEDWGHTVSSPGRKANDSWIVPGISCTAILTFPWHGIQSFLMSSVW